MRHVDSFITTLEEQQHVRQHNDERRTRRARIHVRGVDLDDIDDDDTTLERRPIMETTGTWMGMANHENSPLHSAATPSPDTPRSARAKTAKKGRGKP